MKMAKQKRQYHDIESVKEYYKEHGFTLDETNYANGKTKMNCHDDDGFKYSISYNCIKNSNNHAKYSVFNPFTIENMQRVLDLETDGTIIQDTSFKSVKQKMHFKCSCGNDFTMDLSQFTSGKRYCNYCSKSKRYDGLVNYTKLISEECQKRGYTLLTNDIKRSSQTFDYICDKHFDKGVQHSDYHRFINRGTGCYYCGIIKRGIGHRLSDDEIIRVVEEKGFEYVGKHYERKSQSSSSRVQVHCICKKHRDKGVQIITFENLKKNKRGCVYCCGYGRTKESLQEEFDYIGADLDIINFNAYSDITVKCRKCGNIWDTAGVNIISGHGCPHCCKSRYEKTVEAILVDNDVKYEDQYKYDECRDILPLPFDFYLIDYNTLIEVDGQGHYMPINYNGASDEDALKSFQKIKEHDNIKTEFCKINGINLIRIPYFVLDDKEENIVEYIFSRIA